MGFRKGSIVTVIAAEQGGPNSSNVVITGAEVIEISDGFVVVLDGSQAKVYPWSSLRRLEVTTY